MKSVYFSVRTGSLTKAVFFVFKWLQYSHRFAQTWSISSCQRNIGTGIGVANAVFAWCLVKDRVGQSNGGTGGIVPSICELRCGWLWMVSCTYWQLQPQEIAVGLKHGRDSATKRPLPWKEPRFFGRLTRSVRQTLKKWNSDGISGVPRGGIWGVQTPPPEIPKALQNRAKLNPICENC